MHTQKVPYEQSILVCTNDCQGSKASCGDHQGEEVFRELRRLAKELGVHPRIRVGQAKCLGQCQQGVNIMVFPGEIWHHDVRLEDVPALAQRYLAPKKNDSCIDL